MEAKKASRKSSQGRSNREQQQQQAGEPNPEKGATGPHKRKRRFEMGEVEAIIQGVDRAAEIVLGAGSTSLSHREDHWWQITQDVNALGYCYWGVLEVKHKWWDLRVGIKRKMANIARATRATGGGPPPAGLMPLVEVVAKHISVLEVQGVPGGRNTIDRPQDNDQDDDEDEDTPTLHHDVPRASTTQVSAASGIPVRQAETGNLERYQKHVQKKFERIKAYNALPGQRKQLSSSYIRLLITEKQFVRKEKKQFLQNVGTQQKEMMEKLTAGRYNCSNIEDLFKPDENGDSVTTVVLQGIPGIGKTFTAKKMIVDWTLHKPYCIAFDYAFYLSCRELNQLSNSLSVADLIFEYCEILQPIKQEILKVPEKILFIVDGFDELKFSMDVNEKDMKDTVWEKYPVEITVAKLFKRKVLSEATMVITTRPEAVDILENKVEIDRFAEILGFSEEGMKEYFDTYFEDKSQALVAFNFIRKNDILFSMCYIPIICWVVGAVFKQHMDDEGDLTEGLKSATQVFVSYMNIILKHHHCKLGKLDDSLLQKLGALALNGVKEQKVLFDEEDLKKVKLSISEVPSSFLNMLLFNKDGDVQTVYNFAHLSFQEFLAALYCAKNDNTDEALTLLQEFLHKEKSHLISTVRFLFGLRNQMIVSKLSFQPTTQMTSKMLDWIKMALGTHEGYKLLQLLYCLYEVNEEEFTTHAMKDVRNLNFSGHFLKEIDCNVINYCVQHCLKVEELNLNSCKLGVEEMKILLPVLRRSLMLSLQRCDLTAGCCEELSSVLSTNSSLMELDLEGNNLGDSGVKHLSAGLRDPNCKLQTLGLQECGLKAGCCEDLFSVLSTNSSLTELNLSGNNLGDSGVKHLSAGLRDSNCKIQKLVLVVCDLTSGCCEALSSVLSTNSSLTELYLSDNNLGDSGVKHLSAGLRDPNCKLQTLCINSSLTVLYLSNNNLGDSGVKCLSAGLRDPNCKLQELL
ncbi:NACHT, LRR and PYD domains-containing protein 3-like [Latimeria chalumnae]|uniref:NACHT, LRR and PYD domains-containing protein 3-like n=1 Tax=Latimeria chalumnae TaxID=7897 RepID=UPI00313A901C